MPRRFREPDWPRLMSVEVACAYLGAICRETFLARIAPSLKPPKLLDGAAKYDRHDIDAWVDGADQNGPKRSDADWLHEISDA